MLEDVFTRTQRGAGCLTSMFSSLCHCPQPTLASCCKQTYGGPGRLCPSPAPVTQPSRVRTQIHVSMGCKAKLSSPWHRVWIALWQFAPLPLMVGRTHCPTLTIQGLAVAFFGQQNVRKIKNCRKRFATPCIRGKHFPSDLLNLVWPVTCSDPQHVAEVIRSGTAF